MIHKTTLSSIIEIAWFETKVKYTKSLLGPFWITLSMLILISGLSFVFISLWGISIEKTMPWISIGIIVWNYISGYLDEASTLFIDGKLLNIKISPLKLIFINIFKHIIIFLHNSIIVILTLIFFDLKITVNYFYLIFSFTMIFFNSIIFGILFGFLCCRYRDFILIIRNVIYLLFLMTPVFWMPHVLKGNRIYLADFNIIYQFIQSVRDPLLGNSLSSFGITYISIFTLVMGMFSIFIYKKYYRKLVYWI